MTQQTPSTRQHILEAWLYGTASLQELAERFKVSSGYIRQVLRPFRRNGYSGNRLSIQADTLSISRGLFNVLPSELSSTLCIQIEEAVGGNLGLLMLPAA